MPNSFGIGESRTEDLDDDVGISMRIPKGEVLSGVGQLEISISVGFSRLQSIVFFEERIEIDRPDGEIF